MQETEERLIACTLDQRKLQPRLAEIRALTQRCLLSHDRSGHTLRLPCREGSLEEVQRIVELEQQCCSFLDFKAESACSAVRLTISLPSETDDAIPWLFARFLPETSPAHAPKACGCHGSCA